MPRFFNIDHSPVSIENGPAVMPGDTYDFTDEQVAAGIAGLWSENDPRGPAPQGKSSSDATSATGEQTTEPAQPENQENS